MKTRSLNLHYLAGWLLVLATLALAMGQVPWEPFHVPPEDQILGGSYLIFFFHFPSAFACLLFFGFAGIASIAHLALRSPGTDRSARAAVEVGVLACTIAMVTGSIWAKAAWGVFWAWSDKRLLTVAIMWFTYLAYLALRSSIDFPPQRARFAAVFGTIALVNLPLVHFAIRWFGSVAHPMKVGLETPMRITQWFGALAFLVLYSAFWRSRMRVAEIQDRAARLEETLVSKGI